MFTNQIKSLGTTIKIAVIHSQPNNAIIEDWQDISENLVANGMILYFNRLQPKSIYLMRIRCIYKQIISFIHVNITQIRICGIGRTMDNRNPSLWRISSNHHLRMGNYVKVKRTLLLSGDSSFKRSRTSLKKINQPPIQTINGPPPELGKSRLSRLQDTNQSQKANSSVDFADIQMQQFFEDKITSEQTNSSWCLEKLHKARQLFQAYEMNQQGVTFQAISQELDLTKEQLAEGWLDYQKDRNMNQIKRKMDSPNKINTTKIAYLRSKILEILEKDPFLSLTQIKIILISKLKSEWKNWGEKFELSQKKIAWLLKSAGYTYRKYASIGADSDLPVMEISQDKKIFQFCRFVKSLKPTKVLMYFYHETEISRSLNKKQRWVQKGASMVFPNQITLIIRCLLSPDGIAVWHLSQGLFQRQQFELLVLEMNKKGHSIEPIKRKYLILDKRVISNKEQFCEVVQQYSFDILCQPLGSQKINPVQKWFKALRSELQRPSGNSSQSKRQIIESLLKKQNQNSLQKYQAQSNYDIEANARSVV